MPLTELTAAINERLLSDARLAPYALKARIYENGTVRLQGIVDVLEEKRQAEELVRKFPGVKKIENDITVCTDGAIDDSEVAFEISEELRANPEVPDSVGVKVSGGEAHLVGSVSSYSEAQEAMESAAKARGVRRVHNRLRLAEIVDDASITNSIQDVFIRELDLLPGKVRVVTEDGVVTLQGNLPEPLAARAAELASRVPGVKELHNDLNRTEADPDDQIVVKVMNRIADNPYLNEMPISIEVEAGKIVFSGKVDSLEAKKDIERTLHELVAEFKPRTFQLENRLRLEE